MLTNQLLLKHPKKRLTLTYKHYTVIFDQLEKLEEETIKWCREIMRNSPMAIRLCKSAINAADDGHSGLQVA